MWLELIEGHAISVAEMDTGQGIVPKRIPDWQVTSDLMLELLVVAGALELALSVVKAVIGQMLALKDNIML